MYGGVKFITRTATRLLSGQRWSPRPLCFSMFRLLSTTSDLHNFIFIEKQAKAAVRSINKDIFSRSRNKKTIHEFQSRLFLKMYRALNAFKEKHGHFRVPLRYVIPEGEGFPSDLVGYKLGSLYAAIRSRAHWSHYPYKAILIDLGIVPPETKEFSRYSPEDIDWALQVYKSVNGNLDIPLDFVITKDSVHIYKPYLIEAPLGKILDQIKQRKLFFTSIDVRERWRKLGIKFERDNNVTVPCIIRTLSVDDEAPCNKTTESILSYGSDISDKHSIKSFNQFVEAFLLYKKVFHNCEVPQLYTVRKEDGFPDHLIGYKLGRRLNHIRSSASWMRGSFKIKIVELGIIPPEREEYRRKYSATDIERSLQIYLDMHGHLNIPEDYIVPIISSGDDTTFPSNMIGSPLGTLLRLIKTRRLYFNPHDVNKRWRKLNINFRKE